MNKIMLILIVIGMCTISPQSFAMGKRGQQAASDAVDAANALGNNDAAQQAAGDAGAAIAKGGQHLVDKAYDFGLNHGVPQDKVNEMANTGSKVFGYGKAIEYTGKGAPHVGWIATSAGRATEGDYSGAVIEGVNGVTRTTAVGAIGTAAGVWAGGKVGAMAGSWGGPLGAAAGFVIGCGAAWVGGQIWDSTIGAGANALDQRVHDWQSDSEFAGPRHPSNRPENERPDSTTRNIGRNNAQQTTQNINRTISRPPSGGSGGGGGGGRPGGCICPR
ncbi:MAG: hypothetical protein ACOY3I_07515 [Verrucomicrobiota bacterium]